MDSLENKNLSKSNKINYPLIAAFLTFGYEWRYLKKTNKIMSTTSYLMCFAGGAISYVITSLVLSNLDEIVDEKEKQNINKNIPKNKNI
jgi:uncharacterized membrane protein YbjE (DUF340 family)